MTFDQRTLTGRRTLSERIGAAAHLGDRATVLELDHVTKCYPGEPPLTALDGVSFAVKEGSWPASSGPRAQESRR
jgi:hypothetical protein